MHEPSQKRKIEKQFFCITSNFDTNIDCSSDLKRSRKQGTHNVIITDNMLCACIIFHFEFRFPIESLPSKRSADPVFHVEEVLTLVSPKRGVLTESFLVKELLNPVFLARELLIPVFLAKELRSPVFLVREMRTPVFFVRELQTPFFLAKEPWTPVFLA